MSYGGVDSELYERTELEKKHRKLLSQFRGEGVGVEILQKVRNHKLTVPKATAMIRRLIAESRQQQIF